MDWAIPRYGTRVPPEIETVIDRCRRRGELIHGPAIAAFERAFADRIGAAPGVATSWGRMAFFHIVRAHAFPPGAEIILPALTFWVIPELARVSGLTPVFADVDPSTFTISPEAIERAITPRTCAIVPTHLYGLPCDMDAILAIAAKHRLVVIEDCAHAIGATWRGRHVGTFGDAALFSFQALKSLSTYRGGMAIVRDDAMRERVRRLAEADPWPTEDAIRARLRTAWLQRTFIRPGVFTCSFFPILWAASWVGAEPDVFLWEKIRPLDRLPASYTERYTNVQAAIGLAGLDHLDEWTRRTRAHAAVLDTALAGCAEAPVVPAGSTHAYYQYCVYVPDHEQFVRRAIRRGIDVETMHMDVCPRLPLFRAFRAESPGADRADTVVQLPIHASLSDREVARVAAVASAILATAPVSARSPFVHLP
jgi:dTDP-4-amino-4,6-dideoxygalactose transaminase